MISNPTIGKTSICPIVGFVFEPDIIYSFPINFHFFFHLLPNENSENSLFLLDLSEFSSHNKEKALKRGDLYAV